MRCPPLIGRRLAGEHFRTFGGCDTPRIRPSCRPDVRRNDILSVAFRPTWVRLTGAASFGTKKKPANRLQ
jgi:hypothetical protein